MKFQDKYNIEVGKIYKSNNCGDYKVLDDTKKGERKGYTVRFLDTNHEKWARRKQVVMGSVYDASISNELFLGKVFNSNNYGKFMLVGVGYKVNPKSKSSRKHYSIKFLNTGNSQMEQSHHIWTGEVRDKFFDDITIGYEYKSDNQVVTVIGKSRKQYFYIVKGNKNNSIWHCAGYQISNNEFVDFLEPKEYNQSIGYISYIKHIDNNICSKLNQKWHDMINRCYNKDNTSYNNYGGNNIIVCDRWLCFDNYVEDIKSLKGYNKNMLLNNKLEIDKDKKQIGKINKIYSKSTCCLITPKENMSFIKMRRDNKYFKITNDNFIMYHYNQSFIGRLIGLSRMSISSYLNYKNTNRDRFSFEYVESFPKGWTIDNCSEKCIEVYNEYLKNTD